MRFIGIKVRELNLSQSTRFEYRHEFNAIIKTTDTEIVACITLE